MRERVIEALCVHFGGMCGNGEHAHECPAGWEDVIARVAALIVAEREACARLVADACQPRLHGQPCGMHDGLARAIRARTAGAELP